MSKANDSNTSNKKLFGLLLGPLLCVAVLLLPDFPGLDPAGKKAIAGALWVIIWWMFEPFHLAVTAIWSVVIFSILGVLKPLQAFEQLAQGPVMLFLGATIILGAWVESGLIRRYAFTMLGLNFVKGQSARVVAVFAISCAVLSAFVANIPVAMLFLAVGMSMIKETGVQKGSNFGRQLVMMAGVSSSVGGIGTPIGGAPNLIVVGLVAALLGYNIEFWEWSIIGMPIFLVSMIPALFIIYRMFPIAKEEKYLPVASEYIAGEKEKMGTVTRYEKIALYSLLVAIFLWLFAAPITKAFGWDFLTTLLSTPFIALLVGVMLFVIPLKKEGPVFAMDWQQGLRSINWGVIMFIMGAGVLGISLNSTGVDEWLALGIKSITGGMSGVWVMFIILIITAFMTQVITNLAVISLMVPVVISLAPMFGLNPILWALLIGMSANNGLVFPFSSITISVAVLGSEGYANVRDFFKYGIAAITAGAIVIFIIGLTIGPFIFR